MPKFRVVITGMAVVSQSHIVEADNAELARAKAVEPDTYNNGVWDYQGVEEGTVQCDNVESAS